MMFAPPPVQSLELSEMAAARPLRSPEVVMQLERLGSFHSTRLSFTRTLIRRMHREKWRFETVYNTLNEFGYGCLIYMIHTPQGIVSFVAFADELDSAYRTDRVIAEKWDMCFTLFNGRPGEADIRRLSRELPKQEAGRLSESELVMSRANRSVRIFNSVVDCLASGCQPNMDLIVRIGYLVRTTAVYGNGKFGLMDFSHLKRLTPFGMPFQAEMLTVYMARQFSIDLVEHIAARRGKGTAVKLDRKISRAIGVGNATGLGMAPFLIGHPQLIGQWIKVREVAIEITKSKSDVGRPNIVRFANLVERVAEHLEQWKTDDPRQSERLVNLRDEIAQIREMTPQLDQIESPWLYLADWASSHASIECQELLNSLFLEIHPHEINALDQLMGAEESVHFDPSMKVGELKNLIENRYSWALKINFQNPASQHYFWYVSQEKEEPRLGRRYLEPGAELELGIGVARDVSALYQTICSLEQNLDQLFISQLLHQYPDHRATVLRIQSLVHSEYGEIQANLLGEDCRPIDLLRCKLAIFGATRFDPKSNLWTRITLFQGAPMYDELDSPFADDWAFPVASIN